MTKKAKKTKAKARKPRRKRDARVQRKPPTSRREARAFVKRSDGEIVNTATGLGTAKGREVYSYYQGPTLTGCYGELNAIYETDGMAARICDAHPEDGTSKGFEIEAPDQEFDEKEFFSELESLHLLQRVKQCGTWSRLQGGAAVIIFGGGSLEKPFPEGAKVDALLTVDRECIARDTASLGDDGQIKRGQFVPEFYRYADPDSVNGDAEQRVHYSRVLRMIGADCAPKTRATLDGWGLSVLERSYRSLIRLTEAEGYAGEMLHTASVFILKIEGWLKAIAEGGQSAEEMQEAVEAVADSIDILHMFAIDKNSEMTEVTRNIAGVADLLEKFVDSVLRNSDGIPRTKLLNEQPTGALSAGSEGEFAAWYGRVSAWQEEQATPVVMRVVELVFAWMAAQGKEVPEDWQIKWCDLHAKDEKREAEIDLLQTQIDQARYTMGAVEDYEIRARLIAEGKVEEVDPPEGYKMQPQTELLGPGEEPVPPEPVAPEPVAPLPESATEMEAPESGEEEE